MIKYIVQGGTKLSGSVTISGAKNAAVAILPATLLVSGPCRIENVPDISDVRLLLEILRDMGAEIRRYGRNTLEIDCTRARNATAPIELVRRIRASYYLIGAELGRFGHAHVAMPGGCNFGVRPIDQHIKGMTAMGANVEVKNGFVYADTPDGRLHGAKVYLDKVSVGATMNIIIAATLARGRTVIENAAREPHIVDLANFLNSMGADIKGAGTDSIRIKGVERLSGGTYCIIPDQNGCAIDDAYLYRFEAEKYFLVINAGNIDKDLAHLTREAERYNVTLTNVSDRYAAIAVQGPEAKKLLMALSGGKALTRENVKNALGTLTMEGRPVRIAKTGYTGEPIGYELYCESRDARYFWDRLIELGARPTALGARDTLRMEASLPLYGHEMGECEFGGEIPVYAVPLAKFAVSFAEEKGDFIGRAALKRQFEAFQRIMNRDYSAIADLPYRIQPVYLSGKGVLRKGFPVYSRDA